MDKVILKITGHRTDAQGEVAKIRVSESAEHYFRGGKHYIRYDDRTTLKGTKIPSMIKLTDNSVTITRRGKLESQLYFERGKESLVDYNTPYGMLKLSIITRKLDVELGNVSGDIKIDSLIKADGRLVGTNHIHIEILPASETISKLN